MADPRPTLLFDGDCGICRSYVAYWQALTQDAIAYRPYQDAAAEFPTLPRTNLERAIFLIEPDGEIFSGAAATFQVLRAGHRPLLWALYRFLPGFALLSEVAYGVCSRHRGFLAFATHLLWGKSLAPARYALTSFVFLRLFGAILLAAFLSLSVQILGLVGHEGLLPAAPYLPAAHYGWGNAAYWRLPTLFWFNASDTALLGATWLGALCGAFVLIGVLVRPALVIAFILYLSLLYAGQIFTNYQWDQLLLETDFLAIFLTLGSPILVFLFRLLIFRFLFLAGVTKLLSGDPSWQKLTALDTHFFTQPLPAPFAWPASELPHLFLEIGTAAALVIELGLVFLIFLPRRPRMLAAVAVLIFQLMIVATGNYNFFNLLTMLLCLFLFDDQALATLLPRKLVDFIVAHARPASKFATIVSALVALLVVPVGLDRLYAPFAKTDLPLIGAVTDAISPLQIVNPYGLFITVTTTRREIVLEGSDDGQTWRDYAFKYYPGPVTRAPGWNIPHQPRLDWQMWFAAYGSAGENPWFVALVAALLENRPQILALMGTNPFADRPPRYVRAELYDYRFADAAARAKGIWWVRQLIGLYLPQISRDDLARMRSSRGR
ncbi:MAG: lipase maturation factor family protein [Methylovirgula sp.]